MTAVIQETSFEELVSELLDDKLWHTVCHCSNGTTSWCKDAQFPADTELVAREEQDGEHCEACDIIEEHCVDEGICPWGCGCEDCGEGDVDDDE